MILNIPP
jgi:hypothetical protein